MKPYHKGKFIVIEGADATGKTTQFNLLHNYLKNNKFHVKLLDFPRYYDGFWGKMVGSYLRGNFGSLYQNNPYLSTLPYILDQADTRYQIKYALKKGQFVLSNRYVTSNIHQCAKLPYYDRDEYLNWLETAAYDKLKAVKPDIVIVLHADASISSQLNAEKDDRKYLNGKKNDIAEENLDHQKEASKEYFNQAIKRSDWILIECINHDGSLKIPTQIHEEIINKLNKLKFFENVVHPEQMVLPTL